MLYEFSCPKCDKIHTVSRPMSQSGEPYACPDCGSSADRIYSSFVPQEFPVYFDKGKWITSPNKEKKHLRANGRVLTQDTGGWRDIKKMAREGQRRTLLQQKGHY